MLMECCENAVNVKSEKPLTEQVLILIAIRTFEVCDGLIKGLISSAVTEMGDDIITLHYRGEEFSFDQNIPYVKKVFAEISSK